MASPRLATFKLFLIIVALAIAGPGHAPKGVIATDPDPQQDFCIADLTAAGPGPTHARTQHSPPPKTLHFPDLQTPLISLAIQLALPLPHSAFFRDWPALNTLGLGLVRLDINPGGFIMPHTHSLATEILFCLEGEIYTGCVTNSDNPTRPNKLYAKVVKKGEAFIFPRGLLHFQLNKGTVPAVSLHVLNGQNPGTQLMPVALFGVGIDPDPELLAKSFFISETQVADLESILSQFVHVLD
ncbi:unnamed protein product [Calypogeia fissa]